METMFQSADSSNSLRYYHAFDALDTGSPYGGIGPAQATQVQYPYYSGSYPAIYPGTCGYYETAEALGQGSPDDSVQVDFCDLDAGVLQRFDPMDGQPRRESVSSSGSSSTSSPPPVQDAYGHPGYVPGYPAEPSSSAGPSRGKRTSNGSGGNYPYRRQNRKDRQIQMENEERELQQSNAELRKLLAKLQRQYNFLESRVKSSIPQASQPAQVAAQSHLSLL